MSSHLKTKYRSHTNGELRVGDVKKRVVLSGWVNTRRDHGGIIFIDLRDKYGLTQIVFNPEFNKDVFTVGESLRREDVITIEGEVRARGVGLKNPNLDTGEIEVFLDKVTLVSKSETPPIEIDDRKPANDDIRLEYRYLDLRRPTMQNNLIFRDNVIKTARSFMSNMGCTDIETPLLVKSTPEGARDYVVPSRVNPGTFYALPQSPQLYKQMLMIAGCDRYYQIARCLRDEDLRADRQPEHTQIDFEISFVSQEDIQSMVEGLFVAIFKENKNITLKTPFQKFSYEESMGKYGTDKPDIRYELFLTEVGDIVKDSDFGVFKDVVSAGGIVKCINPPKDFGRKDIDKYIAFCQENGAKGMAWMRFSENGLESNIAKYFPDDVKKRLVDAVKPEAGSILMFIAGKKPMVNAVLDRLRRKLAADMELYKDDDFKLCWVNDFPLFSYNEDAERWEPEHHMFSMPKEEFIETMEKNPAPVLGDLWDLAMNGVELASGSIRISNPSVQKKIMNIIGMSDEQAEEKFGFLLKAYKYGGPIHGGMGIGLDRVIALMLGHSDIREVIAFPKNKNAQCPMDGSPGKIDTIQMKELNIQSTVKEKKKE
jgi:aspartyl-tRNA synthetase